MNSERGLITYSKMITAAGPEDSRPRLCDTFRKYLGQAEGPEQAGVPHSGAQARQRWRDCPRNAGCVLPACKSSYASHGEFPRLGPYTLQNAGVGEGDL